MKFFAKSGSKRAFTLVELLVVIAIIGILAAIVMPAINTALLRGRALSVSTNGRSLYQMLIQSQTEQIYTTTTTVWPSVGDDPEYGEFQSSTDYFRHMVTNRTMNVAFSFFAAPGVPSAAGPDEFSDRHNAWMLTADAEDLAETAPMFYTRNIGESFNALNVDVSFDSDGRFESGSGMFATPFGRNAFVFTTRGGQSYALIKDDLTEDRFENLFRLDDAGGNRLENEVLQP